MEWTDFGIVLGARRHGELNAVVELMTREHGRHLGLVRGGFGSRQRPVLQIGNLLRATWRARLDEHLGYYAVEAVELRAGAYLDAAHALYGIHHLAALCRLLPERDPHRPVFDLLDLTVSEMARPATAAARIARFELSLLAELGLASISQHPPLPARPPISSMCRRRGTSGVTHGRRAVARSATRLPAFLNDSDTEEPSAQALRDGFALTGFFLARDMFEPRGETLPTCVPIHRGDRAKLEGGSRCARPLAARTISFARMTQSKAVGALSNAANYRRRRQPQPQNGYGW